MQPDQIYHAELDLSLPRWHMAIENSQGITVQGEIGMDNNNDMFRIVYQSPGRLSRSTAETKLIWIGRLPSRAFNVRGRID